jgi:hypothetical protein
LVWKEKYSRQNLFSKKCEDLIKKGRLSAEDFERFVRALAEHPDVGDVMPGTGGVRKIRLKSSSKGKSGGFRVCYYYYLLKERIYLLAIYAKSDQENISSDEKKLLREFAEFFKMRG